MKRLIIEIENLLDKVIDTSRYLLVGNAFGKHSIFFYKKNAKEPFLIIKVPGSEEGNDHCANEYKCMEYLSNKKIPNIQSSKTLGIIDNEDNKAYLYGTLFSKSLYCMLPLSTRIHKAKYFNWVTQHLIKIYHHTKESEKFESKTYALCFMHGDLWAGNIGIKNGDMIIYDLEFGRLNGKPLFDLLHFGLYYQVVVDNIGAVGGGIVTGNYDRDKEKRIFEPSATTVRKAFMMKNRLSMIIRRCVRDYVRSCGIGREDAHDLIFEYFNDDRGIKGLSSDFANKIMLF